MTNTIIDTNLLGTIAEVVLAVGVVAVSIGYIFGQVKQGKNAAEKDLNDTLNELLQARDKKILDLENTVKEQGVKIARLIGQVEVLQTQKSDMEILIKTALKEHFAAHPEMAVDLQGKMADK